jgi:hypothetical protein
MELPKRKRIVNPAAIKAARKKFCQNCGAYNEEGWHVHHIKTKGSGGDDVAENLVTLCPACHTKVHSGELSIENIITKDLPGVEEVLQIFVNFREQEESGKWQQAAALVVLSAGLKMKVKDISSETGLSPALIREMIRTFTAFPDESTRVLELSFYHHRLASKTPDPVYWINLAADNGWSTRQMSDEIKKSGCITEKAKRDSSMSKAEKALRMVNEILEEESEASDWLYGELQKFFMEEIAKVS